MSKSLRFGDLKMIIEILKLYFILKDNKSKEILDQAIDFSRSTIILNKKGEFQRVFFESEKDLENFLINYKEENH